MIISWFLWLIGISSIDTTSDYSGVMAMAGFLEFWVWVCILGTHLGWGGPAVC